MAVRVLRKRNLVAGRGRRKPATLPPMSLIAHLRALPPVAVIYVDLDGTLLGPGGSLLTAADGSPTARPAAALVRARAAGITVVPVSGRRHGLLEADCRLLGLADFIAEAGTVVVRGGQVTFERGQMPAGLDATPREALRPGVDVLVRGFDVERYLPWDDGRVGEYLLRGRLDVAAADAALSAAGLGWACVVDNGRAAAGGRAYHLLPRGTGKARAVGADLRARGLDPRTGLAVGDSHEDLTMAREVATYVQVANGTAEAGGNAFAVPGAMGLGVADAIDAVLSAHDG